MCAVTLCDTPLMYPFTRRALPVLLAVGGLLLPAALAIPTGQAAARTTSAPTAEADTDMRSNALRERRLVGRSVQGRPIWAYRKGNPQAERVVLVLGQMHGDERAGVRTARHIIRRVPVSRRADVWIIPTMDPDGYAADTRNNARGVDLNRNWPTGWEPTSTSGPAPASEPETRAMRAFLKRVQPTFIASLHQPFGVIGRSDKNMRYVRRLSAELDLPIARVQVGDCVGPDCPPGPTLTSWYNTRQPGYCVTIEFPARPSEAFLTTTAGPGILRAMFAY
ncbi:hypothetical protein BH24ACT12_BH24ACT12_01220 [soil metagenome]